MDVYFIPLGADRYELYCDEAGEVEALPDEGPSNGRLASMYRDFKVTLDRIEQERLTGEARTGAGARAWTERLKDRALCWLAERIAEQRLLWRLRSKAEVTLYYPDDMPAERAMAMARADLQREADRHLLWMIIDGTFFVASGAFFLVPGPNLIVYYFGFRLVGHYLSRRGATHALAKVRWSTCPAAQLTRLRRAVALVGLEREREVHQVATELHLPHLARFFERTSMKTA